MVLENEVYLKISPTLQERPSAKDEAGGGATGGRGSNGLALPSAGITDTEGDGQRAEGPSSLLGQPSATDDSARSPNFLIEYAFACCLRRSHSPKGADAYLNLFTSEIGSVSDAFEPGTTRFSQVVGTADVSAS
jgi:hypothetical protein